MIAALISLGLVWLAPQDAFVAERDAAAALNPKSARFTIALAEGRRRFRIGERISIVFSYDGLGRGWVGDSGRSYTHFADAVLDRTDGTARPSRDFGRAVIYIPPGVCGCVEGGTVGGVLSLPDVFAGIDSSGNPIFIPAPAPPKPPPPPPTLVTFVLNDGVRFDTPGHYRFYIADHHDRETGMLADLNRPLLISNILELDILPSDPALDEREAAGAIAILASSSDRKVRTEAVRTLRFLGTDRAVDELVLGLNRRSANEESQEDSSEYVQGLFAARDRLRTIARMEAALDDPRQPLSWLHVMTLAALRLCLSEPPDVFLDGPRKRAALNALVRRRVRVLRDAGTPARDVTGLFIDPEMAGFPRKVERARRGQREANRKASAKTPLSVGHHESTYFIGGSAVPAARLKTGLARYPPDTTFVWVSEGSYSIDDRGWFAVARWEDFERARQLFEAAGMHLSRYPSG